MQEFKIGDTVTVGYECNHVPPRIPYVICEYEDKTWYINWLDSICTDPCHWQLISPKERTIEDVEVGDICEDDADTFQVVEVLKNTFAYLWFGRIYWETFEQAKKEGWKIKQPEPEKHDKVCPYGNDDCPKCK